MDINQLQGNRLLGSSSLRLYQLEYKYVSSYANITKKRSFFYRPEFIVDGALWKAIRQGNDISNDADIEQSRKSQKSPAQQEIERKQNLQNFIDNPNKLT